MCSGEYILSDDDDQVSEHWKICVFLFMRKNNVTEFI